MEDGSWEIVMLRTLAAGVTMGALAGGLLAAVIALDLPSTSPSIGALVLAVVGTMIGALIGLACAIPTGLILATARHFLERHLRFARIYGGALGGLMLASLTVAGYGLTRSDGRLVAGAFALGVAAGALNAKFVVPGRRCLLARYLTRRAG
jgi:hypothetical protein